MPTAIGSNRCSTSIENEKYFSCYTDFEKAWARNRQQREARGLVEANKPCDSEPVSIPAVEQILPTENDNSVPTDLDVTAPLREAHWDVEEDAEWRKYWTQNAFHSVLSATWMSRWSSYVKLKTKGSTQPSNIALKSCESGSGEIGGASTGKMPEDLNHSLTLISKCESEENMSWCSHCDLKVRSNLRKIANSTTNLIRTTLSSLGRRRYRRDDSFLSASSLPNSGERDFKYPLSTNCFSKEQLKAILDLIGLKYIERDSVLAITGRVQYQLPQSRQQLDREDNQLNCVGTKHTCFDDDEDETAEEETVIEPPINDFEDVVASLSEEVTAEEVETREIRSQVFKTEDVVRLALRSKNCNRKIPFPPEVEANAKIQKFWFRRFSLFRKFDEGIMMDEESWYSVTPEIIAKHVAERCTCEVIVDGFCGAGGNAIQFAFTCRKVIAIDIDPKKIELAKNNAKVYGVAHKIEFLVGDFYALAPTLEADVVFLSPPWGGTDYLSQPMYDLETMLQPKGFSKLFSAATKISKNIVAFLPKNSDTRTLVNTAEAGKDVEIEQNFINERELSITAYYNDLVKG